MPKPIKDERSPYWQYDFQRNKRRFYGSTGTTSKRKAQEFINRLLDEIASGKNALPEITMDQACDAYWVDKGQHERSSKTTEYQLANLITGIGKNKLLSSIRISDFRAYIAKRRLDVSNASVNREWQLARRVWRHVGHSHSVSDIKWGELRLDEPPERVRELSADEEQRIFDALPDSLKPIVEFAILTGQRKSEVVGLRWDKINWQAGEARVEKKGGGEHKFPLSHAAVLLILEQPEVDDCPFVFTYVCERPSPARKDRPARKKGVRYPFSKQGWDRKWRKAREVAGIGDFRFHDLRHTTATRIMRATGNIKAASKMLGHTDVRTTSRYAHVQMDDLRAILLDTESRNNTGKRLTNEPETRINTEEME
ncbi:tyrosine-type recombinase/integrase [Sphingobium bisphenolivorans]|uniref:tyrosine-type recombinase/integrase n=1 Tax=Sphingobium bisphenolivorans TaxID=1335760 RepID=UPI00039C3741|nr:site-specific integrase [Sphingobium bisphenolivorans]